MMRFPDGTVLETTDDARYWYARCRECGQVVQLIDWNCARHSISCSCPSPTARDCRPQIDDPEEEGAGR